MARPIVWLHCPSHTELSRVEIQLGGKKTHTPPSKNSYKNSYKGMSFFATKLYMAISEWQRYRYVANEGTLHLDHIYLDVMRSIIKKL